jgi:hypothetical protein
MAPPHTRAFQIHSQPSGVSGRFWHFLMHSNWPKPTLVLEAVYCFQAIASRPGASYSMSPLTSHPEPLRAREADRQQGLQNSQV